ncbi:MAG TPA: hypothetical protein VHD56_12585 [Tepidisphaeraceae bacterium]|nr:hypothetical protein [Tepidisphaeraceae bacterium]
MPDRYYQEYMNSPQWAEFRLEAIEAASRQCQRCGNAEDLEVHHLHYDTLGHESLNDVEVLCKSCHRIADIERKSQRPVKSASGLMKGRYTGGRDVLHQISPHHIRVSKRHHYKGTFNISDTPPLSHEDLLSRHFPVVRELVFHLVNQRMLDRDDKRAELIWERVRKIYRRQGGPEYRDQIDELLIRAYERVQKKLKHRTKYDRKLEHINGIESLAYFLKLGVFKRRLRPKQRLKQRVAKRRRK